jgi:WNK lysine deficient protein kinase
MTGGSLKNYLKKFKHPHLRVIKQWCKEILEGLKYLHSQKPYPIIHRDLKSDNIFVSSSTGEVRIGDLGLSTMMKTSHNKTILGTPQYMAPELYDEHYGPSVDIYSFGLCILEMCTHMTPYSECSSPYEIYNKVTSGIRPQSMEMISDQEVKDFIELCLMPVDQRPHADELLTHPFLQIEENDAKVHQPVALKFDEKEVRIDMNIGFRDPLSSKTTPAKVSFLYNQNIDTVVKVSEEIINIFRLDPKVFDCLSEVVRKKVEEKLREEEKR